MSLEAFLRAEGWDQPFFKKLALNDSCQATGHQAGMAVPVKLKKYLPELTVEGREVVLDAQIESDTLQAPYPKELRWHFHTRRGQRPPEYRITGFMSVIAPSAGDILVFRRGLHSLRTFRLLLLKTGTDDFNVASAWTGDRRWGELIVGQLPFSNEQLTGQMQSLEQESRGAFSLMQGDARPVQASVRVARSVAFREVVREAYGNRCAISGIKVSDPDGRAEVEAAHVCPVSEGGSDDPRNGLALTQTVHWAFDKGLVGVDEHRRVIVPDRVRNDAANQWLAQLHGRPIDEAGAECLRVHPEALAWHLEHRLRKWS